MVLSNMSCTMFFTICRCITNIAAGCHVPWEIEQVFDAVPLLLQLLSSTNVSSSHTLKEQCCWAIGNIASVDSSQIGERLEGHGAMFVLYDYFLQHITTLNSQLAVTSGSAVVRIGTIAWTLCNLLRLSAFKGDRLIHSWESLCHSYTTRVTSSATAQYVRNSISLADAPACLLLQLLGSSSPPSNSPPDDDSVCNLLWMLVYLTIKEEHFISGHLLSRDSHVVQSLMMAIEVYSAQISTQPTAWRCLAPALRALGNLISGTLTRHFFHDLTRWLDRTRRMVLHRLSSDGEQQYSAVPVVRWISTLDQCLSTRTFSITVS